MLPFVVLMAHKGGGSVAIVITVAQDVPADKFAEIERLALQLAAHEMNFKGRLIEVVRGSATVVSDRGDPLREALLQHMVNWLAAGNR
jgi:hypothetical protein